MNLRSTKFALLLGGINGVVFYLIYQPVKFEFVKFLWSIKNDDNVYIVLPEIYRIARDVGELFVWTLLFTLASYTAHRFWGTNLKSTIQLWLRIGIMALIMPIVGLWVVRGLAILAILTMKQFETCFWLFNCDTPSEMLISGLLREDYNIKFEFVLLIAALSVNLIYGTILAKISSGLTK